MQRRPSARPYRASTRGDHALSHDFDDAMEAGGEQVDDQEMSKLQALAKRRGVTASVVLRELVRAARVAAGSEAARK